MNRAARAEWQIMATAAGQLQLLAAIRQRPAEMPASSPAEVADDALRLLIAYNLEQERKSYPIRNRYAEALRQVAAGAFSGVEGIRDTVDRIIVEAVVGIGRERNLPVEELAQQYPIIAHLCPPDAFAPRPAESAPATIPDGGDGNSN